METTNLDSPAPKNPFKLTNRYISDHYKGKQFWLSKDDFNAAFVYWVVQQSPYATPELKKALRAFDLYVSKFFTTGESDEIVKFSYKQLYYMIDEKVFEGIPAIAKLNEPKIESGCLFMFCSRFHKPKPDYDFIDLGALARNVFYMILRLYICDVDEVEDFVQTD